ncbi:MAG TPA: hypothetical protein VKT29_13240, partial [Terriglobales bacterium]|nr:hypothetical protein [Terriglobales bacterium]
MRTLGVVVSVFIFGVALLAQQAKPPKARVKKTNPAPAATQTESSQPAAQPSPQPATNQPGTGQAAKESKELHFDMTEVPPVVTHQQATVNGRVLHYTA